MNDTKTRNKAIRESVRKWRRIAKGTEEDMGADNCALCKLYLDTEDCEGCPVYEHTGNSDCAFSPYTSWVHHQFAKHGDSFHHIPWTAVRDGVACDECVRLATAEADFLESLITEDT